MRDVRVDFLRFVGLAMIILAHVNPPGYLFQLRNFDVPLMVLVSGMSFGMSHQLSEQYRTYVWKRVKRLLFPVWKFLTLYFIALAIVAPEHPDTVVGTMLSSYALIDGIGYVWIIRVFLLVALAAPLVYWLNQKIDSHGVFLLMLSGGFVAWELFRYLTLPMVHSGPGQGLSLVVHYIVPYSLIFALGLRLPQLSFRQVALTIAVAGMVLVSFAGWLHLERGVWVPTQAYKYPPSVYYLSYALVAAGILWTLSPALIRGLTTLRLKALVLFIAQNSIWVYLWHIPFVKALDQVFYVQYTLVFAGAGVITFCQVWLVKNVLLERVSGEVTRRNIRMLLTG